MCGIFWPTRIFKKEPRFKIKGEKPKKSKAITFDGEVGVPRATLTSWHLNRDRDDTEVPMAMAEQGRGLGNRASLVQSIAKLI